MTSSAVLTYRYLRLAVVGLTLLLGVSVVLQVVSDNSLRDSISAYYYTPVRSLFVGTLVASGLALIVIKGRERGGEDVLLNLAGLLAPVVAVVPTPIPVCAGDRSCVPDSYVSGVDNNVRALLVVAVVALALVALALRRRGVVARSAWVGLGSAALAVVVLGGLFLLDHSAFLTVAHYGAAVAFFLLMVAVAGLNALASERRMGLARLTIAYRTAYVGVATAMLVTVVLAGVYAVVLALSGSDGLPSWLLVVEAVLLGLFTLFWVLQTQELWDEVAV